MTKKIFVFFISIFLIFNIQSRADEGMWLLTMMKKLNLNEKGLELTQEEIYSINNSSLKDAIVGLGNERMPFGFFCTGEIISDQGLMLTNHHCGYGSIQSHSSPEHDYLKYGFWAKTKADELLNEGTVATIMVRMEDVTDSVLINVTTEMTESEREAAINKIIKKIKKTATKDTHYKASVNSMFEGNRYYLFVYETFEDVRLVGAPPSSIGKFGGDTDNWMWPRHTGDFSMFRIYTGPNGKPAKFSKENIPLKPKHHLPISLKGTKKGDFAMVLGFPGTTNRYLNSWGIQEALDISNPSAIKIRSKKLELMKEDMNTSDKIRIQYASKYAQTANYWKYFIGQSKGLKRLKIYEKKKALEDEFTKWVNADNARKEKYSETLIYIEKYYTDNKEQEQANTYLMEALLQGGEIIMFPAQMYQLHGVLSNSADNKELIAEMTKEIKEAAKDHWKDYNAPTDKKIMAALLEMYYNDVPEKYHLPIFAEINKKFKGDFNNFADYLFSKSIFADENRFNAFLDKPSVKILDKDYAFKLMQEVIQQYYSMQSGSYEDFGKGKRLFIAGLQEMNSDKIYYPDANSTIRLTYGSVGDYEPADAVYYNYFTTIKGIMEKEDPSVDEFIVFDKLKELHKNKDYGRYADADGDMHVCFTTNNDITGGNSGSPVINGKGELIGTAFDGNWEAMSGDIAFEDELQKCINVDIRYALFIIDKFAGAKHLIDEMTIIE